MEGGVENDPSEQHADAPGFADEHGKQAELSILPKLGLYFPMSHEVGIGTFSWQYIPGKHSEQEEEPKLVNAPAGQQVAAPATLV